jgi:hypothetical protein
VLAGRNAENPNDNSTGDDSDGRAGDADREVAGPPPNQVGHPPGPEEADRIMALLRHIPKEYHCRLCMLMGKEGRVQSLDRKIGSAFNWTEMWKDGSSGKTRELMEEHAHGRKGGSEEYLHNVEWNFARRNNWLLTRVECLERRGVQVRP